MKKVSCLISLLLVCGLFLNGCGIASHSVVGIPATEYLINTSEDSTVVRSVVTGGMVAGHGAVTYALWTVCWPAAVAYLGVSGLYSAVRFAVAPQLKELKIQEQNITSLLEEMKKSNIELEQSQAMMKLDKLFEELEIK